MKGKLLSIVLLFSVSLILILFVSCSPAALDVTNTPGDGLTPTAEITPTLTLMPTNTIPTAVMELTPTTVPTDTPPPPATIIPAAGDLGWGSIYGTISDGSTHIPIEGAIVTCKHFSYTSPHPCNRVTTTNSNGIYAFTGVFFHDTDRITLLVEAPGYIPLHFEQAFFTQPEFHADLSLFPKINITPTQTFFIMCTPPACSGGILVCGNPNGCPGGCGTICLTATSTP